MSLMTILINFNVLKKLLNKYKSHPPDFLSSLSTISFHVHPFLFLSYTIEIKETKQLKLKKPTSHDLKPPLSSRHSQ